MSHHEEVSAHVVLDEVHERGELWDVVSAGLQRHSEQAEPHVDHHVRVVPVQGVRQGHQEAEQLPNTW